MNHIICSGLGFMTQKKSQPVITQSLSRSSLQRPRLDVGGAQLQPLPRTPPHVISHPFLCVCGFRPAHLFSVDADTLPHDVQTRWRQPISLSKQSPRCGWWTARHMQNNALHKTARFAQTHHQQTRVGVQNCTIGVRENHGRMNPELRATNTLRRCTRIENEVAPTPKLAPSSSSAFLYPDASVFGKILAQVIRRNFPRRLRCASGSK